MHALFQQLTLKQQQVDSVIADKETSAREFQAKISCVFSTFWHAKVDTGQGRPALIQTDHSQVQPPLTRWH